MLAYILVAPTAHTPNVMLVDLRAGHSVMLVETTLAGREPAIPPARGVAFPAEGNQEPKHLAAGRTRAQREMEVSPAKTMSLNDSKTTQLLN